MQCAVPGLAGTNGPRNETDGQITTLKTVYMLITPRRQRWYRNGKNNRIRRAHIRLVQRNYIGGILEINVKAQTSRYHRSGYFKVGGLRSKKKKKERDKISSTAASLLPNPISVHKNEPQLKRVR